MNTKRFGKLATVAATAALTLQLFAGATSAAVPAADSGGYTYGGFAGNGSAGFQLSYDYTDSSTLSRLYLNIGVVGASAVTFDITRNGSKASGCQVSATAVACSFKTVRATDSFNATLVAKPTASASEVRLAGGWSTTGAPAGGNNSHGDSWHLCQVDPTPQPGCVSGSDPNALNVLVSSRIGDDDVAAGFGNTTLTTATSQNKQSAKLTGLPAGKWAYVNDNLSPDGFGFSWIELRVNGGELASFQLDITYPKNTKAPVSYFHVSTSYPDAEYFLCARGQQTNCFTWDKKAFIATLYLPHNGSLRRTS